MICRSLIAVAAVIAFSAAAASTQAFSGVDADGGAPACDGLVARIAVDRILDHAAPAPTP